MGVKAFVYGAFYTGGSAAGGALLTVFSGGTGAPVTVPVAVTNVAVGVGISAGGAVVALSSLDNFKDDLWKLQESKGEAGSTNQLKSQNQMQNQVEKGQAPKEVDRVDKPHIKGQQPHVHFKNGTSINQDGTVHDVHNGAPNITNKVGEWLTNNGWKGITE